ncbi:copper-binding protein [Pseudorhodoferax sp.]|uniref:copper-binding protein n=1 Tax=Pseudorhodoferax sp. TaxID=1993553 RepID=UPI002DD654A0|nr:copper-binding protein [Pseudorhodoferax sp.]
MNCKPILMALATTLSLPGLALASGDHGAHGARQAAAQADAADFTAGEIRKIDAEAGKVTIKHGDIRNLDMPAMTMVFQVKDKAMLNGIKAGDRVKFKAASEGGKYVVTEMKAGR